MQDIDYVMTLFTWPLRCSLSFLKNNIQTIELTARMRQHACSTRQDASYSYSANTRARQCGIRTRQQHTCTCTCTHVHMCASHMHAYGRTSRTCLQLGRPLQLSRSGRAWICFAIAELMARSGAAYIFNQHDEEPAELLSEHDTGFTWHNSSRPQQSLFMIRPAPTTRRPTYGRRPVAETAAGWSGPFMAQLKARAALLQRPPALLAHIYNEFYVCA